jgi:CubicO group peptidase (beta-lactamase class C family)
MQKHAIPGLAIVLVKDGKVAYEKGFGVTKISNGNAVSANTLFKIGSISKSITALALALLAQDGKLQWDDPLSRHIPELQTANVAVARLTIRQILSHQTGLDLDRLEPLLWPQPNQFEFENIVVGLKVLAEEQRNTSIFRYGNVNYALAGEVVRRASGMRYGEYVQRAIFAPLKMHCVVNEANGAALKSVAQPHMQVDGVTQMVRADSADGGITEGLDAAAGGVRCDANAMGKWLQFQLNPRASALRVSDVLWRDLHSAQAAVRSDFDAALKPIAIETYGMGLQISVVEGEIQYDHHGGVAGMLAYFAVSPSHNSGFAVLMNMSAGQARKGLIEQLSRLIRGKPIPRLSPHPVPPPLKTLSAADSALPTALPPNAKPLDLKVAASYFGRYQDAWFGEVSLCPTADGAIFTSLRSPRFKGKLMSIEHDRSSILWDDKAINSDAIIAVAEKREAIIERFTLMPLGESDFDFGAMKFRRMGDCP